MFGNNTIDGLYVFLFILSGCSKKMEEATQKTNDTTKITALNYIEQSEKYNAEAPIPAQCYTKTEGQYNPCYVCHQTYKNSRTRTNTLGDGYLQGLYEFSEHGMHNHWKNLFVDRQAYIDSVSDSEILSYIRQDNFTPLINWMKTDAWSGVIPEIKNLQLGKVAFDEDGLAKDNSRWVAFNYKPFPSTFWPTNGSTDDVMIRLDKIFSEIKGKFSRDVYFANLSLLEMAINDLKEVDTIPLNEAILNIDLDDDSVQSVSSTKMIRRGYYLGDASHIKLTHMLYPQGTEFLHTVRYIDIDSAGHIVNAARMKEVRYMKKNTFYSRDQIVGAYYGEAKEKHYRSLPKLTDFGDNGVSNGFGWMLWGFIEDKHGVLRKQYKEEQFFCTGCHKSIGTTIDQTFSFPRKAPGAQGWGYIDLSTMSDTPSLSQNTGEYLQYLERVGGGDEYRQNEEMLSRWFTRDGRVNKQKIQDVDSIYELITPSAKRALKLNKAYQAIVKEQSYLYGRDAVIKPASHIFTNIDSTVMPLKPEYQYPWDIRLSRDNDHLK